MNKVANRGIEPRTRGFSRQITRLASIRSTRRIVTNFLTFRPTVETPPNLLPNFCEPSAASWPFCRTASMGCAEVHRPAADIAMAPSTCHFRIQPIAAGGRCLPIADTQPSLSSIPAIQSKPSNFFPSELRLCSASRQIPPIVTKRRQ